MSNSKLLKLGFYRSVSCTVHPQNVYLRRIGQNYSGIIKSTFPVVPPSTILIGDSITAALARFSDVWHNFFCNALNVGIRGDRI